MSGVVDLQEYRRRQGAFLTHAQVCAELYPILDNVMSEPVDCWPEPDDEPDAIETLPPGAPIDGRWEPVPNSRRFW